MMKRNNEENSGGGNDKGPEVRSCLVVQGTD